MSKHETPMTLRYWERIGGTLVLEYPAVKRGPGIGRRSLDGLIIQNGETRRARASEVNIQDQNVIVVQTKAHRLGMYLMGQALFSRELVLELGARSVRTVALCSKSDARLEPLCDRFGIEVVIDDLGRTAADSGPEKRKSFRGLERARPDLPGLEMER